jgi:hypothetical protein
MQCAATDTAVAHPCRCALLVQVHLIPSMQIKPRGFAPVVHILETYTLKCGGNTLAVLQCHPCLTK